MLWLFINDFLTMNSFVLLHLPLGLCPYFYSITLNGKMFHFMKMLKFLSVLTLFSYLKLKYSCNRFFFSFPFLTILICLPPLAHSQIIAPGLFIFNLGICKYILYINLQRNIYISKYANINFPEEGYFLPSSSFLSSPQFLLLDFFTRSICSYLHNYTTIILIYLYLHPSGWPHIHRYVCKTNWILVMKINDYINKNQT